MNELIMENTYMKHPYKGAEIGFIFEKQYDVKGYEIFEDEKTEIELEKGYMIILDPQKKIKDFIEGISPYKKERHWLKMGALVCIQKDKINDAHHIIHTFMRSMKPIEYQVRVDNKLVTINTDINKLY
jgi:hypothetical protein